MFALEICKDNQNRGKVESIFLQKRSRRNKKNEWHLVEAEKMFRRKSFLKHEAHSRKRSLAEFFSLGLQL